MVGKRKRERERAPERNRLVLSIPSWPNKISPTFSLIYIFSFDLCTVRCFTTSPGDHSTRKLVSVLARNSRFSFSIRFFIF